MLLVYTAASVRVPVAVWPPDVIAAVQHGADVAPRLTLTLPDGSQVRLGGRQVQSWGTVDAAVSLRDGKLGSVEPRVTLIDDEARSLARLGHRWGERLRGCAAEIRLVSPRLVSPAWAEDQSPVVWRGVVGGPLEQTSDVGYELPLRPPDAVLRDGQFPRQRISQALWPAAKDGVLGQVVPLIYGPFDSSGVGAKGLVPAYRVGDVKAFPVPFVVAWGRVNVRYVYVDGERRNDSTYSVATLRGATTVQLDEDLDHALSDSTTVACDVDGYDDVGDGSGALLVNPARQLRHLMDNFWWGDWRGGAWLTGTAPVDERTWSDVVRRLDRRGYRGAMWFGGERVRPSAVLDTWCDALGVALWWTPEGRIAWGLPDPTDDRVYLDQPFLRASSQSDSLQRAPASGDSVTRRVELTFSYNPSAGASYAQSLAVMDHRKAERSEQSRQVPFVATEP